MYLANFFGMDQWIIVLLVVLLLFGGKKIPELMRGVGKGVGELHKGIEEGKRHFEDAARPDPTPSPESQPRTTTSEAPNTPA